MRNLAAMQLVMNYVASLLSIQDLSPIERDLIHQAIEALADAHARMRRAHSQYTE